jgi:glycosyltransferase involved in cell wall biosynthesis
MRVAIVHDWLVGMRGGEKCLEVFCELFPGADLYTLVYSPEKISSTIWRMKIHTSWVDRMPAVERTYRYYLPLFPRTIEALNLRDYDLILSSSHCVAKGIFPHRALHVAYIHAPMRYVWDMYDSYFDSAASFATRVGMRLFRGYLQRWDLRSSQRVDHFIANSNNVAAKIEKLYERTAAVIHPPVELERFHIAAEQQPYYLIVSALVPYKKIDIAIGAFNKLKLPLKIAGEGPLRKRLEKMAQPNIEFLGWVDSQDLPELYASCQALIFPGEEDFGIVPLEAQASGRPVIAYGKGGVLESIVPLDSNINGSPSTSGATGVFFQELTSESLIEAVRCFHHKKQLFDPDAIRCHASTFSRDRFKSRIRDYVDARLRERP